MAATSSAASEERRSRGDTVAFQFQPRLNCPPHDGCNSSAKGNYAVKGLFMVNLIKNLAAQFLWWRIRMSLKREIVLVVVT